MESAEPTGSDTAQQHAAEMAAGLGRIEALDLTNLDDTTETLVQDLETAYEELRVADEQVRVQRDQITQLLERQHLLRWQHERMTAMLPVPVLMSDTAGIIRSVNASAAALLQMGVARLVGKPLVALVSPEDRSDLRRLLGTLIRDGASFRRVVSLRGRNLHATSAEMFVSRLPGPSPEVTWMLLVGAATERPAASTGVAVPEALTWLALLPTKVSDRQEALTRAADICQQSLGPATSVSVSVGPPNAPTALAATSQVAQTFDGAQLAAGEGPCTTAFATGTTVESHDLRHDPRWPRLAECAPESLQGAIAVPLEVGEDLVGALTVYVSEPLWPPRLREDAELMASTVAAVLFELGLKQELEQLAADLGRALESRAVIDQAKGIVMADRHVDAESAFEHLVRLSSTRHVKLKEIAQEIVDGASRPP